MNGLHARLLDGSPRSTWLPLSAGHFKLILRLWRRRIGWSPAKPMASRDDKFWAEFLGVEPTEWNTAGVSLRPHVGLLGYQGFWCFRRNSRTVISAPSPWLRQITQVLSGFDQDRLLEGSAWAEELGADFQRSIGPAFQGCIDAMKVSNAPQGSVRQIDDNDRLAVDRFRIECGAKDWEHSGLDDAELWRHAYFEGALVTALAGYRTRRHDAGDPCILTHPAFRGSGHGLAVARAVIVKALANGQLVLFQTLEANQAAVRLALSLGYQRYACHLAIRLTRAVPGP